jgi:hypothetical protein
MKGPTQVRFGWPEPVPVSGVIGGERERRIWAPVAYIHTADSRKVKFLTSMWGKKPERCRPNQAVYGLIYAGATLTLWLMRRY